MEDLKTYILKRTEENPDGCWLWVYATDKDGYGCSDPRYPFSRAHRLAFYAWFHSIPAGAHICHRCDEPSCCNPGHLWSGTHQANNADKILKGRDARGSRQGHALLTEEQVRNIKSEYVPRIVSQQALAHKYGVTRAAIGKIVTGVNWAHI